MKRELSFPFNPDFFSFGFSAMFSDCCAAFTLNIICIINYSHLCITYFVFLCEVKVVAHPLYV